MPHRRRPHLIACALGALLAASLLVPAPAEAARKGKKAGPATVADPPRKAQRSKKMVFNGSAETTADRDRRLRRECRGRPNSGACLGYAY